MTEPNGDPYEAIEPFEPAYDTWTPCEDRTPEEIREQDGVED